MKIALSLPDALFAEAEAAAKDLGVSRSKLIRTALEEFLARRKSDEITRRLNESYAIHPPEIDPFLERLALDAMRRVEWEE